MSAPVRFATLAEGRALTEEKERRGLATFTLDGTAIADGAMLLAALGRALEFPAYYGANWDGFEECLGDLPARLPSGCTLLCHGAAGLWHRLPRKMGTLVSIWLAAAETAGRSGTRLELVFVLENP